MQTPTQSPPTPAQAPAPPVSITTVGPDGKPQTLVIPKTASEVEEILTRRRELSNQLTSVSERRSELVEEVRTAPDGVSKAGLEDRIRVLDQRIIQLENDISASGRQLAAAPAELIESSEGPSVYPAAPGDPDAWEEGLAVGGFSVFLGALAVYFIMRRRWRKRAAARAPKIPTDSAQRLERLEQGMDAIAVEIERISEGQRFVTKLLSESHAPLGASNRLPQHVAAQNVEAAKG